VKRKLIVPGLSDRDLVIAYAYLSLRFSPDGNTLACMSGRKGSTLQVRLWDVRTGRLQRKIAVPENPGMGGDAFLAFSPDSQLLATVGHSDIPETKDVRLVVRVWDWQTGTLKRKLWQGVKGLRVAFAPDGTRLAVANNDIEDHSIKLWDLPSGRAVRTLSGHQLEAKCIAFSPDGKLLASASEEPSVRVWDLAAGKTQRTLAGAYDQVYFLPDGRSLVTAGGDNGEVRFWNLQTGQFERSVILKGVVSVTAVSPDGQQVAEVEPETGWLGIWRLW
jgi:WD40 repeat protein